MGKRHEAIGIKQVVRMEWYDYALDMLINCTSPKEIRKQLDAFICERLESGGYGERGEKTYTKAVTQIMKCWVSPDRELIAFRNNALSLAQKIGKDMRPVLHWAVTTAAYPFWHRVAEQVGRLLNLQEVITQHQIRLRCFEGMGERSTVERSVRRVIRTFVVWGFLIDMGIKGHYQKLAPVNITDQNLVALLIEAALHATPEGCGTVGMLINNPAFFPFQLPNMTGSFVSQHNRRIFVIYNGFEDELLKLDQLTMEG
jgi:hypothetical protein